MFILSGIKLFRKQYTPTNQNKIPLLNNSYMINLIGSKIDMEQTTAEIKQIAEEIGHTVKVVTIVPNGLVVDPHSSAPKWRTDLANEVYSSENVIINKVGEVTCDVITELNRSVRAVSYGFRHPWAFKIDPNATTRHESVLLGTDPYKFNCDQISQVYPLLGTHKTKKDDMETYLRPSIQD